MRDIQTAPTVPTVGMGATHNVGSDSYPYTIIEVSANGQRIRVQEDTATRVDSNGMSESQDWIYERNPSGKVLEFSLRKFGIWREKGEKHCSLSIGIRRMYQDPSF